MREENIKIIKTHMEFSENIKIIKTHIEFSIKKQQNLEKYLDMFNIIIISNSTLKHTL